MPTLFRVHLTLVQKINIIEKCGLPGFDRKLRRNMVPQYNCLNFIEKKTLLDHFFRPRILIHTEIPGKLSKL